MAKVVTYGGGVVTTTITAGGTVSAGDIYEGANGIGVYSTDAVSGDQVAVIVGGIVEIAKATGTAYTLLDQLYWDTTANNLTKTNTDVPAGLAMLDAASGATTARILLNVGSGDS